MSEVIELFKKNTRIIEEYTEEISQETLDIIASNKAKAEKLAKERLKHNKKLVHDLKLKGK